MDTNNTESSTSFVMPSEYFKNNLPKPNNSEIHIETAAEKYVAAIQFSGFSNDEEIKKIPSAIGK